MAKATLAEETAQAVIRYIIDNRLLPGDKLPTEPEFMKNFPWAGGLYVRA